MAEPYEFTEIQAVDILDMQLRQLTRLSRIDLEREMQEVQERITELQSILDSDEKLRGVIKTEMLAIRDEFATPRVCQVAFDTGEMSIEDLVEDKELVIVMTAGPVREGGPGRQLQDPGPRRSWRERRRR
jgi:DNA gyrase subunit A